MNNELELAKKQLMIQSVNLRSSSVYIKDDIVVEQLQISNDGLQGYRTTSNIREFKLEDTEDIHNWEYRFSYSLGLRFVNSQENEDEDESEADTLLEILATFEAKYTSNEQLNELCIKEFSKENVGYHIWPYWRELVQSYCCRLGIHPIAVATYIVNSENKE